MITELWFNLAEKKKDGKMFSYCINNHTGDNKMQFSEFLNSRREACRALVDELGKTLKANSLCALGQTAANPIISTLTHFKHEYIAHIQDKICPAGECKALASIEIIPELCKGCGICKRQCPVNAITGEVKQPHKINPETCIKCGACVDKCPFKAIHK